MPARAPQDDGAACPVCASASLLVAAAADAAVVARMQRWLAMPAPGDLAGIAHDLRRCVACGLEFADPMQEPGASFYAWINDAGFDYPTMRWEWGACHDYIASRSMGGDRGVRVLDLGCGNGAFLALLAGLPGVVSTGVDHNPDVVAECRRRGIDAQVGWLDEAAARAGKCDVVCLWHVVEHVADPLGTLRRVCADLLAPGGAICFSVPLSPMSTERAARDPFNEPPHHLTRWTHDALQALATALGMQAVFDMPAADGAGVRTLRALTLQATGGARRSRAGKLAALAGLLARSPAEALREWRHQRHARHHRGRPLPDVVMVRLER